MATGGRKGGEKTGGRKKGTQNVLTKTVKETVLNVFNKLQEDHQSNLLSWAKREETEFYKIASKLIPTELNAHLTEKIIIVEVPE